VETQTIERQRTNRTSDPIKLVALTGAAALIIAAAWFWLATRGVTVAPEPRIAPGAAPQQAMRTYYRWQATTLAQERYYTSIAIAGVLCLAATALYVRDRVGRHHPLARIGSVLVGAGAFLWVTGSIVLLGGHRAVGLMATHANPIQATNSIAFTIDTISQAFELATFALIGAGMLALAAAARRRGYPGWVRYTIVAAVVILVTAGTYAAGDSSVSDVMLVASGGALLPVWLIWASHVGATGKVPVS
jgi:hypothetical protein